MIKMHLKALLRRKKIGEKGGITIHISFLKFLQVFDISGGKIQFSQSFLKTWYNVQTR